MNTAVQATCWACQDPPLDPAHPSVPPSTACPSGRLRPRAQGIATRPCSITAYWIPADLYSSKSGFQQISERFCDLRPRERFHDQQDSSRFPGTHASVRNLRSVADDDDGQLGVIRMVAHGVKE